MNRSRYKAARSITRIVATLFCLSGVLTAQNGQESSLKRLTLEELANVEVTSVGRRPEPVSQAAAAISTITQEDIRRSGARHLVDVLRLAVGLEVARSNGNTWAVSARGFNNTSANKMQVLIDRRSVYSPLFAGTFWDVQGVMLEDVERIEVIRGPGATLWGANAVNGIINVVTKQARDTQGGLLVLGGGNEERAFPAVRYGGPVGSRGFYRVWSRYAYKDPLVFADGRSAEDAMQRGLAGFRTDLAVSAKDQLMVQGDFVLMNARRFRQDDINARGGDLLGRWTRQLSGGSTFQLQTYYDRTSRSIPPFFDEVRNTFDLDTQHNFLLGRQQIVWGAGYRASADRTRQNPILFFEPQNRTLHLASLFAQDEITLVPDRLQLIFGSKFEHNSYTGWEVQPGVRIGLTTAPRQLLWGAISRATRTPTRLDTDVVIPAAAVPVAILGNKDFKSEDMIAYELGYRFFAQERFALGLSTFFNNYDDLRSQEAPARSGDPIVFGNTLRGHTYGAEIGALFQLLPWWQIRPQYSHLEVRLERKPGSRDPSGGTSEANDPKNQFSFRSMMDLPGHVELDFWVRQVSALPNPVPLPGYTTFDVRLGFRPSERLELSLVGQNLPDERHAEFQGNPATREEIQRGVYGKVTWSF